MKTDAVSAGKYFKIDSWPRLKHAAFRLALLEMQPATPDLEKIARLSRRFNIGAAVAFYRENPELLS